MKRIYTDQGATFGGDRKYRYSLWRTWAGGSGVVLFVMLNPSTADEHKLDPTLRRCEDFARRWGFASMVIANIFPLRDKNPKALYGELDEAGRYAEGVNHVGLMSAARDASKVIAAWGKHGRLRGKAASVEGDLRLACGGKLFHLGLNKDGSPRHPLYLRADTEPIHWTEGAKSHV